MNTRQFSTTLTDATDVLAQAGRLDVALVSAGELSPSSTLVRYNLVGKDDVASLTRAGAVGDILCRFVDAEGGLIPHPLNDCVISADPALLRRSRRIVLSSGGWEKAATVLAAVRLLKPEVLITDEVVAELLAERD